ncbi:hypothetical protein SY27_16125 [Flavobacterium sp. 316]|uniref:Phage protein n=1 Tax=Flavobacterium sediminilitoris TaxID=2024526 RepID=A0ABY4HLJ9_9FLAO|nr:MULTISPECIES: hypothetical protein [Flavobacterium]KIX20042.1 hypothetical protein SY27_16125 [Flavobacterium sp. 316]UOX33733.1 hypothetical protein LXD69_17075 [Flavobacterium sediminilitoris]
MNQEQLIHLHNEIQIVIDAMAVKEFKTANNKLVKISDEIDDLLDTTKDDKFLVELSKYQVLLKHLQVKLNSAE